MRFRHIGLAALLMTASTLSFASTSTATSWSFKTSSSDTGHIQGSGAHTSLSGTKHGIDLDITAWSSSLFGSNAYCQDSNGDRCIQRSRLTRYGNSGLGVINGDEGDDTPNHSVDNNHFDFDMILLSFSEAINISAIDTGWNYTYGGSGGRTQNTAGASVMAFTGGDSIIGTPFASNETWADITNRGWTNIGSDFKGNGSNGHIPVTSSAGVFSKYWLVGAAHAIERNAGHLTDHIKISGVSFMKEGTSVIDANAPASIAFLLGFGVWLGLRRSK
ncbi:exosortase-dependent surface protein XDP1 [Glaciecola sp. SC05]|uniref:exosortase-dependent surface protein XDP1 n=1 Tax=Glaciecola sp. SC05 TaxID=1987355 RepID=UPI0035279C44